MVINHQPMSFDSVLNLIEAVFGELALLNNTPRSATVRALSAVETYTLSEADFSELQMRSLTMDQH